jgi:hypothetical protein
MTPMAPTFCLRRVFWTAAMTVPTAVVWIMVLPVLARASRGWKVACWSAMGGVMGGGSRLAALNASTHACTSLKLALGLGGRNEPSPQRA